MVTQSTNEIIHHLSVSVGVTAFRYSLNNREKPCGIGWVEKLKMSKKYHGHKIPVVIHKNKDISLFTF